MIENGTYFITGIDTDTGKSYATAIIANRIAKSGKSVITQKFIQTGCHGISEDILTHRRLMGVELQQVDVDGTTCPEVYAFPASPHLASALENRKVNQDAIRDSTVKLGAMYDVVLVEGAGGLLVPLEGDYLTADYVRDNELPVMIVTSPRLGSLNHTLLTIEACVSRGIQIAAIIYNHYPENADPVIARDTLNYITDYAKRKLPNTIIYETEIIK